MATCRDWLSTLWSASYKGVPFYAEQTSQEGGRRLVVHEFPFRDDPFIEDLGEKAATFSITAYVASDAADIEAAAFSAILASDGPGLLVLPTHGPIEARCETFSRKQEKDRHGYIAFEAKFYRDGSLGALVSVPFLGQMIFAAVDLLASAAVGQFSKGVSVVGYADFVSEGTTAAIEDVAASIETIRTTYAIDQTISATARDEISTLFDLGSSAVDRFAGVDASSIVGGMFSAVRTLSSGMDPTDASKAFVDVLADFSIPSIPAVGTSHQIRLATNRGAIAQGARLAALSAYAEGLARRTFLARPEGVTARADAAEFFDAEMARATTPEVVVGVQKVRNAVVDYLSKTITTLAPVVTVEAPLLMPSLWWAWRLYGDPTRSDEIVARNGLKHPSFVPKTFEALAS